MASHSSAMVTSSLRDECVSLVGVTDRDETSVVEVTGKRKTIYSR